MSFAIRVIVFAAAALAAGCASVAGDGGGSPLPVIEKPLAAVRAAWSHTMPGWRKAPSGRMRTVVVNGTVITVDGANWLRAFRADTGAYVWERPLHAAISAGLGTGDDMLLAGTGTGEVLAFAQDDGRLLWRARVSSEVLVPPQATGDVVMVRTADGKIHALGARDGAHRWTFERGVPPLTLRGASAAVVVDDQVFAGLADGKLVALSLRDGSVLWEAVVAEPQGRSDIDRIVDVDADPVVAGEVVYAAAYQGRIMAFARKTGRPVWARDMSVYTNMLLTRDALYVSDAEGALWALDPRTGEPLWKQEALKLRELSAPVLYDGYLVAADREGYLHVFAQEDGRLTARYHTGDGGLAGALNVTDGLLYAIEREGAIEALRIRASSSE